MSIRAKRYGKLGSTGSREPSRGRMWHLAGMLAVALMTQGCPTTASPPSDAPPADRELEKVFSAAVKPQPPVLPVGESPRSLHVYVDSSKSMRGFVASPQAKYVDVLDRLLDDASSAGFRVTIDSFSESVKEMKNARSAALLDPSFYEGSETSFPNLFHHVANERGQGTISVVVTDMVQSGGSGDQRALLAALQEVTRSNPEILLLAFRSAFRGTYYIEGRKTARRQLDLSLDGTSREQSRPFYVLIIADNREDLAKVRQYLQPQADRTTGEQLPLELNATGPALTIESINLAPSSSDAPVVWTTLEAARSLPVIRRELPRFALSFFEVEPPATEPASLQLRLKVKHPPKEAEIRSADDLQFDIWRCSFKARRPSEVAPADVSWGASLSSKDHQGLSDLNVSYQFPRPQPQTWDTYKIRIIPGPGNLLPPVWALDWSTLDDSSEKNGYRTLKLDVFIDTILRSIKEKVPFSEAYIILGRGE